MCALIRKHVACALIMAEGGGDSGEIVPSPESTSFVDTTPGSEHEDESTSLLDVLKALKSAAQNRKRKVLPNRGRSNCRCSSSCTSSEPKRVIVTKIKIVSR